MIRTQVYLSKDQARRIKLTAISANKSQSEIIREALDQGLSQIQGKSANAGEALQRIAKLAIRGGDPDASTKIDQYLYEDI